MRTTNAYDRSDNILIVNILLTIPNRQVYYSASIHSAYSKRRRRSRKKEQERIGDFERMTHSNEIVWCYIDTTLNTKTNFNRQIRCHAK